MGNPSPEGQGVQLCSVASALGEKPYLCTVPGCGKRFTEYSSLYKHHVVHTHCKPYTCSSCGKTYRQTSTLATHRRSSHGELEAAEEGEQALYEQRQPGGEQALCQPLHSLGSAHVAVGTEKEAEETSLYKYLEGGCCEGGSVSGPRPGVCVTLSLVLLVPFALP